MLLPPHWKRKNFVKMKIVFVRVLDPPGKFGGGAPRRRIPSHRQPGQVDFSAAVLRKHKALCRAMGSLRNAHGSSAAIQRVKTISIP